MGLQGVAQQVSGAEIGAAGALTADRGGHAEVLLGSAELAPDGGNVLGQDEQTRGGLLHHVYVGVDDVTHGGAAVDDHVGVGNLDVQGLQHLRDLHTQRHLHTKGLGNVTAQSQVGLGHGLTVLHHQTDVVHGLGVEDDHLLSNGQLTGSHHAARDGVDQVDLVTHGVDVGHVLDEDALCQLLSVGVPQLGGAVVLDGDEASLDVGVFHDGTHTDDDVADAVLQEGVAGVEQRLTLHGVDEQGIGTLGQLGVGGEARSARANDAVILQ